MSIATPTHHEVMQAVRSGRCSTSKKHNPAKKRVGVYGPTLEAAKLRLAARLKAGQQLISMYVDELLRRGKLYFTGNRLTVVKGRDKMHKRNRNRSIPASTESDNNIIGSHNAAPAESSVDPRLAAWPEYASEPDVTAGDWFRRSIWGRDMVPATIGSERWLRERAASMADHPSASRMPLASTA